MSVSVFTCSLCRNQYLTGGWCPWCATQSRSYVQLRSTGGTTGAVRLSDARRTAVRERIEIPDFPSLQRSLAGGFVPGSVTVCYGAAGLGKTRVALTLADRIRRRYPDVLYVSTEQTVDMLAGTATLLGIENTSMLVAYETYFEAIVSMAKSHRTRFLVLDSLQGLMPEGNDTFDMLLTRIVAFARASGTAMLCTSHETKEGDYMASRKLEHTVDAMVHLRARVRGGVEWMIAKKYRYGAVGLVAVLLDTPQGGFTDGGLLRDEPAHRTSDEGGDTDGGAGEGSTASSGATEPIPA